MTKPKISCCIITYNEEYNIHDCLESVKWVNEIVVVDSFSTDKTTEIAKSYTDKVILNKWGGYIEQKNFALSCAEGDWILCLDADERVTPELKEEILKVVEDNLSVDGYCIKRHTYYLGKWINHCGWYPDYKIRLIRRGKGKWGGVNPHDKILVDGETGYLKEEMHHLTYRNFAYQLKIINRFSDVFVHESMKRGRKTNLIFMFLHPPIKFLEVYVWRAGFLDGLQGFIIAIASSFYVFTKHVKLWEKMK